MGAPLYLVVADFRAGLDRRREIQTAPAGSLWVGHNVHLTRGGEVEKRKAFSVNADLSGAGGATFGLAAVRTSLYTFGSGTTPSAMPPGITYQRLAHYATETMVRLVAYTVFAGKIYAIAEYSNGDVLHFYDGTAVAEWQPGGTYWGTIAVDCITMKNKVIVAGGSSLIFSKLNDASDFDPLSTGAGIIDVSSDQQGMEELVAISKYQGNLAVYARRNTQRWSIDQDLSKCFSLDGIENSGVIAAKSAVPFGNSDTFILNDTGVRSIRARDSINIPGIYDIGTPIDTIVTSALAAMSETTAARAMATIEPVDGRYMLALDSTIYVFSYFPGSKISAWSTYGIGGQVTGWAIIGKRLFARVGDAILEYGAAGAEYDACVPEVVLPFLDADKPAHEKEVLGIDASVLGTWAMELGMNLDDPDERELVATLTGPTFSRMRYDAAGRGTHFTIRMVGSGSGAARIGNIIVHYENNVAD